MQKANTKDKYKYTPVQLLVTLPTLRRQLEDSRYDQLPMEPAVPPYTPQQCPHATDHPSMMDDFLPYVNLWDY